MKPNFLAASFLILFLWAAGVASGRFAPGGEPPRDLVRLQPGFSQPQSPALPVPNAPAPGPPTLRYSGAVFGLAWLCPDVYAAGGASVRLAWDPSTNHSVAGYKIHYGATSGNYTHTVRVKGRLTAQALIENLEEGKTYFFAITSYDAKGKESALSAEVTNGPAKDVKKLPPGGGPSPQQPSSDKMAPSKTVTRTPEGKMLPTR